VELAAPHLERAARRVWLAALAQTATLPEVRRQSLAEPVMEQALAVPLRLPVARRGLVPLGTVEHLAWSVVLLLPRTVLAVRLLSLVVLAREPVLVERRAWLRELPARVPLGRVEQSRLLAEPLARRTVLVVQSLPLVAPVREQAREERYRSRVGLRVPGPRGTVAR